MNWIEKLRAKSNPEKRFIAFNTALIITLFIFAIWAFSVFYSFDNVIESQSANKNSPFRAMVDVFSGIFGSAGDVINDIK